MEATVTGAECIEELWLLPLPLPLLLLPLLPLLLSFIVGGVWGGVSGWISGNPTRCGAGWI